MLHSICEARLTSTSQDLEPTDRVLVTLYQDGAEGGVAECGVCGAIWRFGIDAEEHDPSATRFWWSRVTGTSATELIRLAHQFQLFASASGYIYSRDGHPALKSDETAAILRVFERVWSERSDVHRLTVMDSFALRLLEVSETQRSFALWAQ